MNPLHDSPRNKDFREYYNHLLKIVLIIYLNSKVDGSKVFTKLLFPMKKKIVKNKPCILFVVDLTINGENSLWNKDNKHLWLNDFKQKFIL